MSLSNGSIISFHGYSAISQGDAGIASAHNARVVIALKKVYVFHIKKNFGRLFPLASAELAKQPVVGETRDRAHGMWVIRQVRRVALDERVTFPGAVQCWGVRQMRMGDDGVLETEDRVYISNAPWGELSDERILKLVRLHWGIENNCNWTADVIFDEDTHSPCKIGFGVPVASWLCLLAYNLTAVTRANLHKKDGKLQRWERVRELFYQALFRASPSQDNPSLRCIIGQLIPDIA